MDRKADGWNYIETCFILWKCKNCNYHFAMEEAKVCDNEKYKCPACEQEHSHDEQTEEFEAVIDYYGG